VPGSNITRNKGTLAALAVIGAVTLAFFFPLLNGSTFTTVAVHERASFPWRGLSGPPPRPFPQSDQADLNLPWQTFETRTVRDGIFPFWDPDSYAGGYPFFANGSSAAAYPPRLILALTTNETTAHALFSLFHVFFAGVLMYALMKELGAGLAGSLFAAIAWMLSSFVLAWLHLEVVAPMAVFTPLDLLVVRRALRKQTIGSTAVAGIALGMTLLAGHLLLLGIVWLVAALYAAGMTLATAVRLWRAGSARPALIPLGRLGAIVGISIGIAAVVLLPTAAVVSESARDPFTYERLRQQFLASAGDFRYSLSPPPLPVTMGTMHQMAFAGTATALLAVVGALSRRPGGLLGRALAAGVFAVAVGTPATWIAYHVIPGFQVFRPYSRLLIFWTFAVTLLGGLGLDAVVRALWRRRDPSSLRPSMAQRLRKPLAAMIIAVAVVTTAYQLGRYGRDVNPPFVKDARASSLYRPTPLIARTLAETHTGAAWPGRVLPVIVTRTDGSRPASTLFAAHHLLFGIDSASGYDSVMPRRTATLLRLLQGGDPRTILRSGLSVAYAPRFASDEIRFDLLARAGITTIVATPRSKKPEIWSPTWPAARAELIYDGPDGRLFRLPKNARGPWVVFRHEAAASETEALRRFADPAFDERTSVILEDTAESPDRTEPDSPNARIISADRGVNSAVVVAETNAPGWLVLPDSWSRGWTARIDGRSVPVLRADYVRRAVKLPAGRSRVEFRYRPERFALGATVSIVTIAGMVAVAMIARRRRRRGTSDPAL
jgi:hypothetical protein